MDYKKLGLKCGLEIHQQLEGKKLFCSCPTSIIEQQPDFVVHRQLRAAAGEHGDIDIAARQEEEKKKTFAYQGYYGKTCLVELDEEPPHPLNQQALFTALQLCALLQAKVSPLAQVMRKTVVDGSNTSGFQRTGLIARDGRLDTAQGPIPISWINIEEDACRNIEETEKEQVYRLDRLGIPLIEIGTGPDIHHPEQCQEVAKKLGFLLRSLAGVKRGLGTIRQDVNVSIAGGSRVEIKGAQDLRQLPLLVELEAHRQVELLNIKKQLQGTRLSPLEIIDCSLIMHDCPSAIIQKALQAGGKVLGMRLNGFAGFLGKELQPKYRLGTELAGRAKVIARVMGLFHSDELPNYGITDLGRIRKKLRCESADAFVLVADSEEKARRALQAAYQRAQEVLTGVPSEVRKANADATTSYLRPMPGAARMYPETDVPLLRLTLEGVEVPETLDEKIKRFQERWKLSIDLATHVARSDQLLLFEEMVQKYPDIKPAFIAETIVSTPLDIKRQYGEDPDKLTDENFRQLFAYLSAGRIHKDIVIDVLIDMIKGSFDIMKYQALSTEELHRTIQAIVEKNPGAPFGAVMGQCVKALQGKASGKIISETLKMILEKGH